MEKVQGNYSHEWRWVQTHSCGCQYYKTIIGGPEPEDAEKEVSESYCPRCVINKLLKDYRHISKKEK